MDKTIIKQEQLFSKKLLKNAFFISIKKLNPLSLLRNPVMLSVEVCCIVTTIYFIISLFYNIGESSFFTGQVSLWLWLTVFFATFAESLSEGRGQARAESMRKSGTEVMAKKLDKCSLESSFNLIPSKMLKKGDHVLVESKDIIPIDGEVVIGAALVNESVVTGESASVIREAGGDRSAVTGGTVVVEGRIVIKITVNPGEAFLDRMITMVEGAKRRKTPNEIALEVLLISLTAIFILVVLNLKALSIYSAHFANQESSITITVLLSLFVCLAPTTIAALLPAIGIAGMDRLFQKNVVAFSGKAIEAAGDVNILLLDKTGTITLGNRQASSFIPVGKHSELELAEVALKSSVADETPEGRSVVVLAKKRYNLRIKELNKKVVTVPFTSETRISGIDLNGDYYRKGAYDAMVKFIKEKNGFIPNDLEEKVSNIAKSGGTPLVASKNNEIYGVIFLKDILKGGIKERFQKLRKMGIKTIMITGDNSQTAAAIAAEAEVDDFLAEARPEDKLKLIKDYHKQGYMVAMTGDGTNDAPALAQADVAVAMNTGTQAAREAANIIDLDSNPTKLLDIVEIGKQILMTTGALTTFSISNDIAKYFAIIPAALISIYPQLEALNIMHLASPYSAILSAVIFNAIIIPILIPLSLKGINYKPMPAQKLLIKNLFVYGFGGIIAPFIGIKLIDMLINIFL